MIPTFHFCHAPFVHPIRRDQPSRSPSASRRWRADRSRRTTSFDASPAIQIGNIIFHNWKKTDRGSLNFVQALTESCDTWFYQVGIKTGADPIIDWAQKLGFGAKCGIPLRGEVEGRVPNDQYMKATHGRKLLNGDIANLSIGQGDC